MTMTITEHSYTLVARAVEDIDRMLNEMHNAVTFRDRDPRIHEMRLKVARIQGVLQMDVEAVA